MIVVMVDIKAKATTTTMVELEKRLTMERGYVTSVVQMVHHNWNKFPS